MLVQSSTGKLGTKIPVQVLLSVLVIVEASAPLVAVMSSLLEKEVTTSEKTRVTVALSPGLSFVSSREKELTEGASVSTS